MKTRTRPLEVSVGDHGQILSGLVAEPDGPPRALLVALHGHGMTSRYFAGPADPSLSLLELGASLGFLVWAPDRLGYGASSDADPSLFAMYPQAALLAAAVDRVAKSHKIGAGCLLVGHSFGFKLALAIAGTCALSPPLLGVDGSGSGLTYTFVPGVDPPPAKLPGDVNPSWGPARLYPADTFRRDVMPVAPMAPAPEDEARAWIDDFRRFGPSIRVPVRVTLGEHDRLWVVDTSHFDSIRSVLPTAPWVDCEVQSGSGHNVSLSHAARAYHLRVAAFAERCIAHSSANAATPR